MSKKLDEESDYMEKLGALEVLQNLIPNKICYQILTTKSSFEVMTKHLISENYDTKRFVYILLKNLIEFYEKHERLEKRINIDNYEDDDLMNSHSGSGFMDSKKSKNSRK